MVPTPSSPYISIVANVALLFFVGSTNTLCWQQRWILLTTVAHTIGSSAANRSWLSLAAPPHTVCSMDAWALQLDLNIICSAKHLAPGFAKSTADDKARAQHRHRPTARRSTGHHSVVTSSLSLGPTWEIGDMEMRGERGFVAAAGALGEWLRKPIGACRR
jgi:hypothetical protein